MFVANNNRCREKARSVKKRQCGVAGASPEKLPWGPDSDRLEDADKFAVYLNESKTGQMFVNYELRRYSRI